jgi:hypothetical protein
MASDADAQDGLKSPTPSETSYLHKLPPEIRSVIFTHAARNFVLEYPRSRELYQPSPQSNWDRSPQNPALEEFIPALERALFNDEKIYFEAFTARLPISVLVLRAVPNSQDPEYASGSNDISYPMFGQEIPVWPLKHFLM